MKFTEDAFKKLLRDVKQCTHCRLHLPDGSHPVVIAEKSARIAIIGQAPGRKVNVSGIPWDDASGKRLRAWLKLDPISFYDSSQIAMIPMGFCFPGITPRGGDYPPRPECAPLWHSAILDALTKIELTFLVGQYSQRYYLAESQTMTKTIRDFKKYHPKIFPLPHPSWRTIGWENNNPWFVSEVIPELRKIVHQILNGNRF